MADLDEYITEHVTRGTRSRGRHGVGTVVAEGLSLTLSLAVRLLASLCTEAAGRGRTLRFGN